MEIIGIPETHIPSTAGVPQLPHVFALEEYECGETSLVEMELDTGDAHLRRCTPRRVPFAVCAEMARQIDHMQAAEVIQPSSSPWASPVVMVQKKDGTHYRQFNAVTLYHV